MSDLISREEAYKVLTEYYHHRLDIQHKGLREALNRVPTAEPKHGRWIGVNPMVDTLECSVCGENILGEEFKSNYCPNCGCRMDEVEKDGEERPETHRENA